MIYNLIDLGRGAVWLGELELARGIYLIWLGKELDYTEVDKEFVTVCFTCGSWVEIELETKLVRGLLLGLGQLTIKSPDDLKEQEQSFTLISGIKVEWESKSELNRGPNYIRFMDSSFVESDTGFVRPAKANFGYRGYGTLTVSNWENISEGEFNCLFEKLLFELPRV